MNTPETKKAIKKVFERLSKLSPEEVHREIEKHGDGDIANILLESGAIDYIQKDLKHNNSLKATSLPDRESRQGVDGRETP